MLELTGGLWQKVAVFLLSLLVAVMAISVIIEINAIRAERSEIYLAQRIAMNATEKTFNVLDFNLSSVDYTSDDYSSSAFEYKTLDLSSGSDAYENYYKYLWMLTQFGLTETTLGINSEFYQMSIFLMESFVTASIYGIESTSFYTPMQCGFTFIDYDLYLSNFGSMVTAIIQNNADNNSYTLMGNNRVQIYTGGGDTANGYYSSGVRVIINDVTTSEELIKTMVLNADYGIVELSGNDELDLFGVDSSEMISTANANDDSYNYVIKYEIETSVHWAHVTTTPIFKINDDLIDTVSGLNSWLKTWIDSHTQLEGDPLEEGDYITYDGRLIIDMGWITSTSNYTLTN